MGVEAVGAVRGEDVEGDVGEGEGVDFYAQFGGEVEEGCFEGWVVLSWWACGCRVEGACDGGHLFR